MQYIIKKYLVPDENNMISFNFTAEFEKIFGSDYPQNARSLKVTNVDCLFSNFKQTEDGKVYNYDYEWIFEFPIPYEYVLWRALKQLYGYFLVYLKGQISLSVFLERFGMDNDSVQIYEKMEKKFTEYAFGKDKEQSYLQNYRQKAFMQNIRWV